MTTRPQTIRETAAWLGVSRRTLFRLMAAGRLRPIHPTPGRTLFTEKEIDSFLKSLERRPAPMGLYAAVQLLNRRRPA